MEVFPGISITDPTLQFAVLLAVALVVQFTIERVHLPGLIGLLVIGMVLGPGGTGFLPREPMLDLLGSIGLIYVMFMAGLEIDFSTLRTHPRETVLFGIGSFVFSLVPATIIALFLGWGIAGALLLGTLISSHTLLAYPIVKNLGLLYRRSVVAAVGGTLITDTLALVLLVIVIQFHAVDSSGLQLESFLPLILLVVIVALSWLLIPRLSRWVMSGRASQAQKALYVLVVLLTLASVTELIGTEKILGAFLAGICLNGALSRRDVLREHVEFVGKMLFIPFFFISTGTLLEISVFTDSVGVWGMAGFLLALVILGKATASAVVAKRFNYSRTDRVLLFGLTLPQAAATLAVTMTARDAGVFGDIVVDAVIVLVFVTCLAGPMLVQRSGLRIIKDESLNE